MDYGTLSASVYSSSVVGGRGSGSTETSNLNSHQGFSVSAKLALECISKKCFFCACFDFGSPKLSSVLQIISNRVQFNIPVRSIQCFHLCNVQWRGGSAIQYTSCATFG